MPKREFIFEIKEIKNVYDSNMPDKKRAVVHITTGMATIKDDEIEVLVDDDEQPHGMFVAKDNLFKRIIRKIHEVTK